MTAPELAQGVVATVATICMIGLGFLYRPSRATALWSLTFIVVMATAYAAVVAKDADIEVLRLSAMGVLLATPGLIWSGLRAHRGARPHEWITVVVAVVLATALPLLSETDAYPWTFRIGFAGVAVFAALGVVELRRRPDGIGGTAAPLALFSLVVVAVAAVSLVAGILSPGSGSADAFEFLRTVNALGMLAYIVCALVTLLWIARDDAHRTTDATFHEVAGGRLQRAQRAGERSWALLYVQLDDAADLRTVTGDAGFAAITERLRDDVAEIFPTWADIGRITPSGYAVLLAQPTTVIRERVRTLLRTVAAPHDSVQVGTSASVGWAGVAEFGYDLDVLMAAARAAADRAATVGGDRWERALG